MTEFVAVCAGCAVAAVTIKLVEEGDHSQRAFGSVVLPNDSIRHIHRSHRGRFHSHSQDRIHVRIRIRDRWGRWPKAESCIRSDRSSLLAPRK